MNTLRCLMYFGVVYVTNPSVGGVSCMFLVEFKDI